MSSTIAFAINNISNLKVPGVIIIIIHSDQIHFSTDILLSIQQEFENSKVQIINCKYDEGSGPPTYFYASLFPKLRNLKGHAGAKIILKTNREKILSIPFKLGHLDLDQESDLDA